MAKAAREALVPIVGEDAHETIEYVIGSLDDEDQDDDTLDALCEMLEAHAVAANNCTPEREELRELLRGLRHAQPVAPPPPTLVSAAAPPRRANGASPSAGRSSAPPSASASASAAAAEPRADDSAARLLQELVPHASLALCRWAIDASCGTEDAAELLLTSDHAELEQRMRAAEARAAAATEERRSEASARRRVIERYENVAVPSTDPGQTPKLSAPRLPYSGTRKEALSGGPQGRYRFLEGQVVSTKGEKMAVVDQKEEWDGGSRGKVITKGKRGVGYR